MDVIRVIKVLQAEFWKVDGICLFVGKQYIS